MEIVSNSSKSFMKLSINKSTLYKGLVFTGSILLASACLPESDSGSMNAEEAPAGTFTITPLPGQTNTYLVQSHEPGTFPFRWDFGKTGGIPNAEVGTSPDTVYYPFAGEYTITLFAANSDGAGLSEKVIEVEESDPEACKGNLMNLTGCDVGLSKQWKLIPAAGALTVGPPDGGVWWSSNDADAVDAGRTCLFNDVVTFFPNGKFTYDDTGDFRVDDEGGNPWPTDIGLGIGCHSIDAIPAKYKSWGSGTFTYNLTNENKMVVIGTGAHLGLYKAGENGTTSAPEPKVTYEILELTADKLVVRKMYSWGYWKFVYVPVE